MTRRNTAQQKSISDAFQSAGRPISIQEIHEIATTHTPSLGLRTVYRVVNRLLEDGVISPVAVPNQPDRYELAEVAATHHHHFLCESCDRVFDVDACPGGLSNMLPKNFKLLGHEVSLWGLCPECAT